MRWLSRVALCAALIFPVCAGVASAVKPYQWEAVDDSAFRPVDPVRPHGPPVGPVDVAPEVGSPSPGGAVVPSGEDVREMQRRRPPLVEPSPSPNAPHRRASPAPHVPAVVRDPAPVRSKHRASGTPTWYCLPGVSRCTRGYPAGGFYAAAGPSLRVGDWRGRTVTVCGNARKACLKVKLIDYCACGGDHFLDLYHAAWDWLGRPSRATVKW